MAKNLFMQTCEVLNIPHTRTFTNRIFNEHPYKYSLFGLSQMLEGYGVSNHGVRFVEKEVALDEMAAPFVAQVSGDLALVTSINADSVTYRWYDDIVHVSREQFLNLWSGVVLLVAPDEHAGEPHYVEHRHAERIQKAKAWGAVGCVAIIMGFAAIQQASHYSSFTLSLFILNLAGLYLSYLLIQRQLKVSSNIADRLCNLLKHATCTDILDTSAAKVAFGISWSEIGAAYFSVNTIALLLFPETFPILGLFSFATLSYTVWSLWYQRFRAHTWCALCLLVQVVFILQAIVFLVYVLTHVAPLFPIHHTSFIALQFAFIVFSYLAVTLFIHLTLPFFSKALQADQWRSDYRNFKLREEVFEAILSKEKRYDTEASSSILFGEPDTRYHLTVLTNPYCNPCAAMHARMSDIRQTDCCVELVFSSFGKEYDRVCRLMIATYLQLGPDRAWQLYEKWYAGGKSRQEAFFDGLGLDAEGEAVQTEYAQHKAWREQTGFSATPTLLVNGYRMPSTYQMEDFVELMKNAD